MPLHKDQQVYRSWFATAKNLGVVRAYKSAAYRQMVSEVLSRDAKMREKTDEELREMSQRLREEAINGRSLDSLLVPAFSLVRETAGRVLGMRHYPVQLLGGTALHFGHIIEMATGEGKTLVATLPSYLNALIDRGVHVVTVNDYLAKRDAEEMGQVHRFLGLTVACIVSKSTPEQRRLAYRASITYATNKELGFDYLRDELKNKKLQWFDVGMGVEQLRVSRVQRPDFYYAIVDEADSILIDDARTPLIIGSAPPVDTEIAHEFNLANKIALTLKEGEHYTFDRKERRVEWVKDGEQYITKVLGGQRSLTGHRIDWHESCLRALKANVAFHRDVDYVVEKGEVVIVDESTGRKMPGRQWEDGLHQAVCAKEKLEIQGQNETLARTTYQIFFNRYEKLSGLTGTMMTDASEIAQIFRIGTIKIPTNRPCLRIADPDLIYGSEEAKWNAVVKEVRKKVEQNRAVLVGTRSIEKSEVLSKKLDEAGIKHVVLNARFEAEEAAIVAEAGKPGRVTVATNMAGRGTDIKLDKDVAKAGGLHVIGTERHESRRVDNQLIGRAARQGDPGSAQFFVSVEDPLIRRYRPKKAESLAKWYRKRMRPIRGMWMRSFFRRVQLSIEKQHRKIRFQLIQYDRDRAKYNRQLGTE